MRCCLVSVLVLVVFMHADCAGARAHAVRQERFSWIRLLVLVSGFLPHDPASVERYRAGLSVLVACSLQLDVLGNGLCHSTCRWSDYFHKVDGLDIPSLHIYGSTDTVISPERSKACVRISSARWGECL